MKESKIRSYNKSRFSFNVKGGRCEACNGDGVKKIEKFAFDTCKSLRKLTIPRSCTEIGDHIFPRIYESGWYGSSKYIGLPEGFMLYCYEGSYTEQYAKEENAPFTYLKENESN